MSERRYMSSEREHLLILVYTSFGIDVLGPWSEVLLDNHIKLIVDSRKDHPVAVYRVTTGVGYKEVTEWKEETT